MKIPYGRQEILNDDIQAVCDTLVSDFLTQGPEVTKLEENFAKYTKAKYAVAFSNATTALHAGAVVLGLKKNQRIITTPITFAASGNCALFVGAEVDLVDINSMTYLLDLDLLEKKLKEKPANYYSGIVPVSFAGHPLNSKRLKEIAEKYSLWIMEDNCHAPGGKDSEQNPVGSCLYCDLSVFSFHPVKHIAAGEGGMITTNSEKLYKELLQLRTHNITREDTPSDTPYHYDIKTLGYNYRMTDIQAALANSQLHKNDQRVLRRQEIARFYDKALSGVGDLKTPFTEAEYSHAYHLYVIQTEKRKELFNHLKSKGIFSQVHYVPIHQLTLYKEKFSFDPLPVADEYFKHCLSIPMFPSITQEELNYVVETIKDFFQ